MRLDNRRQSNNISDRRRVSGKTIAGGGIVAVIIGAVITFLSGGNIGDVINNVIGSGALSSMQSGSTSAEPSAEEQRLYDLASKVLAGTEDVWAAEFERNGWGEYEPPQMVIYSGSINTACGQGSAQMGPFYCSADQTVYLDLDFFETMQSQYGAGGDFTYAYVIAHEVGHHVQYLLGILDDAHRKMAQLPEKDANKISVQIELQADYFAGVWGHVDNKMFGSIEPGDIENAVNAAAKIGDDYLQQQAYGRVVPDSFNHGTSAQRQRWLTRGLNSGDPTAYSPFNTPYQSL